MSSLNKVQLIGNLGKDPEMRTLSNGKMIANLSIATAQRWKDRESGERKEKTEWHRVVVFNEALADLCQKYVRKGSKIYVEGSLQTRKWTDQSGADRYSTEVVLQNFNGAIVLLDARRDNGQPGEDRSEPAARTQPAKKADFNDDDIPF